MVFVPLPDDVAVPGFVVFPGLGVGVTVGFEGKSCWIGVGLGVTAGVVVGVTLGPVGSSCAGGGVTVGVGTGVGVISGVGVASIKSVGVGVGSGCCAFLCALQDTTNMMISTISTKPPTPTASSFIFLSICFFLSCGLSRSGRSGSIKKPSISKRS